MRPVFLSAIGFAAALAISELIGAYALILVGACALFALSAYLLLRNRSNGGDVRKGAAIVCCAALVGSLWHAAYTAMFYSPAAELMGVRGKYTATVRDYPKRYSYGAGVEVELNDAGANARVRLQLANYVELRPGDRITFYAKLDAPDSTPDFDFLSFYRARGVFLDGKVYEIADVEQCESVPLRFYPTLLRRALGDKFDELYSGSARSIVRALCIGDRSTMSTGLRLAIRAGGLSHLLAISGMHVTMLCGAIVAGSGDYRRKKLGASALAMLAVLMFILVCGAPASAVRAFVMHGMLLIAMAVRRDADPLSALGLSLILLLAINPFAIADAGLQLSFLGTLGLLLHFGKVRGWVSIHIIKRLAKRSSRLRRIAVLLTDAVSISAISTLYTAPVIAKIFGAVPLYGVFSSIFGQLLTPIALVGGLLSGLVGFVAMPAAKAIAALVDPACSLITGVAYFVARLPFSLVDMTSPYNICAMALSYLLIIIWRLTPSKPRGKLCAALACASFVTSFALGELERRLDGMDVTLLNVGQGQSILLTSGSKAALIDCGGNCYDGAGCVAAEALMLSGRRELDTLILTHYHSDHSNGLGDLADFISIRSVWSPPCEEESESSTVYALESNGAGIHIVESSNADIPLGSAALTVYRPVGSSDENESGLCVEARCGGFEMLVTGDIGFSSEQTLLERERISPVDLLIVGHHGSKNSTGNELLDAASPQAALISVGENSYGHPAPSTVSRLVEHGCGIYRTDLGGNIRVRVGKEG